jgi:hypothetical protein
MGVILSFCAWAGAPITAMNASAATIKLEVDSCANDSFVQRFDTCLIPPSPPTVDPWFIERRFDFLARYFSA